MTKQYWPTGHPHTQANAEWALKQVRPKVDQNTEGIWQIAVKLYNQKSYTGAVIHAELIAFGF